MLSAAIPDVVDCVLFQLLHAIDSGELKLTFRSKSGEIVDLTEDGFSELGGWLLGSDGWCVLYSKTRWTDHIGDLQLPDLPPDA